MARRPELAVALGLAIALAGCGRRRAHESPQASEPPPPGALAAAPGPVTPGGPCTVDVPLTVRPAAARVVAIGDLHGDDLAARAALRLAGAIDADDHWIGGALVVVQTGDVLDRGDGERAILDRFARLRPSARAAGGDLVALDGNHELLNAAGDFSYATLGGSLGFADLDPGGPALPGVPAELRGRVAAFRPGGPYARQLAGQPIAVVVGDTVFVHGGILPAHVRYGLPRMNREVACWLAGQGPMPELVADPDSPVWTRALGFDPPACDEAARALAGLGLRRMVIAHTVQAHGISSACGDTVWRIDVGLAALYGGPLEVLELEGERVRVLGR